MVSLKRSIKDAVWTALRVLLPLTYRVLHPFRLHRKPVDPRNPRRILVLNGAHIGDVVIATSILPILRSAYPEAQIGFVTGSWSRMVLERHPDVQFLHCIDHWLLNRSNQGLLGKIWRDHQTRKKALREIRPLRYDIAICLYTYKLADLLEIAWAAEIPQRLAFRHSLYAPLATALTNMPEDPFLTQGAILARVLRPLSLEDKHFQKRQSRLAPSTDAAIGEVCELLGTDTIENVDFRVIHMGSGARNRELPLAFWREVAQNLSGSCTLIFTGMGSRETKNADQVIAELDGCINACGRLSWDGFVALIRFAEVLYGVESMAGHVAATVGTRCIVAYTGMAGVARWRPESDNCTVVTKHLPCAPCRDLRGCKEMTCLRDVNPQDLLQVSSGLSPHNLKNEAHLSCL